MNNRQRNSSLSKKIMTSEQAAGSQWTRGQRLSNASTRLSRSSLPASSGSNGSSKTPGVSSLPAPVPAPLRSRSRSPSPPSSRSSLPAPSGSNGPWGQSSKNPGVSPALAPRPRPSPSLAPRPLTALAPRPRPRPRTGPLPRLSQEQVYNLDYEQYKINVISMIYNDYQHHLMNDERQDIIKQINDTIETIDKSNVDNQINVHTLLNTNLWQHDINTLTHQTNADKVFVHIYDSTDTRELTVVSYYGDARNPIKGDQTLDEVGEPMKTAQREFNEETGLVLRYNDTKLQILIFSHSDEGLFLEGTYNINSELSENHDNIEINHHHVMITLINDGYDNLKGYFALKNNQSDKLRINEVSRIYMKKYLKYKNKYLKLKNM